MRGSRVFSLAVAASVFAGLLLIFPFGVSAGQRSAAGDSPAAYEDGVVLVGYQPGTTAAEEDAIETAIGAARARTIGRGTRVLRVPSGQVPAKIALLLKHPKIRYAEPNYILHADAIASDPSFGQLWGLRNTGQTLGCGTGCYGSATGTAGADISATSAWDVSTGGTATVVGVVDTGIDYNHPDLQANVWSAPSSFTVTIAGKTITCSAGTHGFNAITNSCNPMDDNNHGSHVSGTIGASGNNGTGVVGVNWSARIMGLKFLDSSGSGSIENAINAIEFAIQAKSLVGANVRVLSNSWGGGGFSQALLDEINKANANNMLFVAAAGNNGTNNDTTPRYPSSYAAPNIISVAATDDRDQRASFSNYGASSVHLGAPGVDVLSTTRNNTYKYLSGTSMATPHVSGTAALLLSVCTLDTAGLKSTILNNVDLVSSMSGKTTTGGRLNADKAIRACSGPPPPPDFSLSASPSSQSVTQGTNATYNVTINRVGGFSDAVSLDAAGVPSTAVTFNPASTTGSSSQLTVATGSLAPGSYTITISGTSASLTRSTSVSLTVNPQPSGDFSLSATPSIRSITAGGTTTYAVTISRSGGFAGAVSLSVTGLPASATSSFSPNGTTGTSSTLTVSTSRTGGTGIFTLTITGTSGTLTHTTSVKLYVSRCYFGC